MQITLSCEPQELPLLQATTMSELTKLQREGPREEEIKGAVEAYRRDRETAQRTNSYWLHRLVPVGALRTRERVLTALLVHTVCRFVDQSVG